MKLKIFYNIWVLGVSGSMLVSKTKGNCSNRLGPAKTFIEKLLQAYNSVWLEYLADTEEVVGSNPSMPTKYKNMDCNPLLDIKMLMMIAII